MRFRPLALTANLLCASALAVAGDKPAETAAAASDLPSARLVYGQYMATAGDCIACHTRPDGKAFEGGLPIDTPFGTIYTPNITPSKGAGIGSFSDEDFLHALQDGISPSGHPYYPALPYPSFTKVKDDDLLAIKEYLMSLEPSNYQPPKTDLRWPFSVRDLMFGWQEIYFDKGRFQPDPSHSDEWNRGAYLVEGLGHCGACHTPRNMAGATEPSEAMTGAIVDGWYAPDLTSDLSQGIGRWSVDELATFLQTGKAPAELDAKEPDPSDASATEVLGPMAEVVHDSLSKLHASDLRAMAVYLKDLPPKTELRNQPKVPDVLTEAAYEQGRAIYTKNCSGCHQDYGQGLKPYFPALRDNPVVNAELPNDVLKTLLLGAPADPSEAFSPNVMMPAFGSVLTDEQIATVASYIRANWGNDASPVTAEAVKALRK
ncbi:c-type cytochrome [Thiorhodococcus mannitoliphagus]|uniref:C-type cytochrome n=1 Tax=Thiorhodococcus mannitoliphagus TaxID=329406 RepID=A0A6P1DTF9_9GAMM|nr:cytochrome c [Thiorhodococcus mannitoliphagus]NEX21607.1 c-type cytochrome [Thiorhodococcus mannitoliphagus]